MTDKEILADKASGVNSYAIKKVYEMTLQECIEWIPSALTKEIVSIK